MFDKMDFVVGTNYFNLSKKNQDAGMMFLSRLGKWPLQNASCQTFCPFSRSQL